MQRRTTHRGDPSERESRFGHLALRLALREITSHRGWSLLVAGLIALPLATISAIAVVWASASWSGTAAVAEKLGSADYALTQLQLADGTCHQTDGDPQCPDESSGDIVPADFGAVLPAFDHYATIGRDEAVTSWAGQAITVARLTADAHDPLLAGYVRPTPERVLGDDEIWVDDELARAFGVEPGDELVFGAVSYRIAAVLHIHDLLVSAIIVPPTHPLAGSAIERVLVGGTPPAGEELGRLNELGVGVETREYVFASAPSLERDIGDAIVISAWGIAATLVAATVAGAAFTIGVRRQRRWLALLGATGADRRWLLAVVRRQGVVLGLCGGLSGVAVGLFGGLTWAWWRWTSFDPDVYQVAVPPWPVVAGLVVVGTLGGLAASEVPARQVARQDVLAGVQDADIADLPARLPVSGLVSVGLGIAVGILGALQARADLGGPWKSAGVPIVSLLLVGFGVLRSVGYLLDLMRRHAGRFPLAVRMAVRDMGRNRTRAIASVAAMLAMSAIVGSLVSWGASAQRAAEMSYLPSLPVGWAVMETSWPSPDAGKGNWTYEQATDAQIAEAWRVTATVLGSPSTQIALFGAPGLVPRASMEFVNSASGLDHLDGSKLTLRAGAIDDIAALVGPGFTEEDRRVLDAGGVIVSAPELIRDEQATILVTDDVGGSRSELTVPARLHTGLGFSSLIVDTAAAAYGLPLTTQVVAAARFRTPTTQELANLDLAYQEAGVAVSRPEFDPGPDQVGTRVERAAGIVGAILLGIVGLVVGGLAQADGRRDLASLAAVGAAPAALRRMGAVTAVTTLGLGLWAGLMLGGGMTAVLRAGMRQPVAVPWGWLIGIGLIVPVVCAGTLSSLFRPPRARMMRLR